MTVLVTGGSGLVGSHVIEALRSRGEAVRALVRPRARALIERMGAEPIVGDVTDPEAWRRAAAGVRGIVHAAALVARRASFEEFVAVNVGGTRLAVAAARAAGARLVHLSSVAVYGGTAAYPSDRQRRTEDYPFSPIHERDFYGRAKRLSEEVVRAAAEQGGLPAGAAALRPTVIYGARDRLFSPGVIRAVRSGWVPEIGPGTNHLSCVYAGNVAAAAVLALDAGRPGFRAYNVTEDAPPLLSEREFFAAFAAALGVAIRRPRVPRAVAAVAIGLWTAWQQLRKPLRYARLGSAAVNFVVGENPYVSERARAELGWCPPFTAREAIPQTVCWFLENEAPGR